MYLTAISIPHAFFPLIQLLFSVISVVLFLIAYDKIKTQTNHPFTILLTATSMTIWGLLNLISITNPNDWYWAWSYRLAGSAQLLCAILIVRSYFQRTTAEVSAADFLLRTLVEKTDCIVYSLRRIPNIKLDYVSPGVEAVTGYSPNEFYENHALSLRIIHHEDRQNLLPILNSIVESPGKAMVARIWRKDSAMIWVEHINLPTFSERGELTKIQGIARDITHEKQLESRNDLLKEVALMVMEEKPLTAILSYICDKLVNIYGFNFSWIGLKEHDGSISVSAVEGGAPPLCLHELVVRWDDTPEGQGISGKVIRSGKTITYDMEKLKIPKNWHDRLAARNVRSGAAFPLKTKGNTLGVLVIYSSYQNFFSSRIVSEIESFAEQVALAIHDAITKQQLLLITTGLRSTTNAVLITDRDFVIQWNNPAFMELTRPDCQSVLNLHFPLTIESPTQDADLFTKIRSAVLTGSTWKSEFMLHKRDRSLAQYEITITSVKNEKGEPSHFIIVFHDLTQRKQAESALQRYKLLYQRANDIILISLPDGQIIEANPAAENAYGYTRDQLLTMRVNHFFEPRQDISDSLHILASVTNSEEGYLLETEHHRQDGSTFPVEVSSVNALIEEKTVIFSTIRDITDRKQAELHKLQVKETIAQAEKLASLGRMAASISHEINQPLNSIKVITDSIQYWRRKGIETEAPDLINAISNISLQADQIDKVIKHVRAFLHGKNAALLAPCSLNSIIESALSFLEAQLLSSGIHLRRNLANDLPPVLATPTGLEEIIINLIINAFHALKTTSQKDKRIIISTTFDDSIVMEVSDNGPGIASSLKDQIFEPFFSTTESEGMGLGLAIVKSIVTSYDGRIKAVNNEQGGATFRVELPIWRLHIDKEVL